MSWQFDGDTSRAYIPTGDHTNFASPTWSISWWFKILGTGVNAHQHYFFHKSGVGLTSENTISARINEATNVLTIAVWDSQSPAGGGTSFSTSYDPSSIAEWTSSGWVHAVITKTRPVGATNTVYSSLYLNNHLVSTDSQDGFQVVTGTFIVFGKIGNASTARTLSGCLAEWTKFDRCLSPGEVNQLYRGHSPLHLNPTLYFPMRNDYIDRVKNLTGVGINNVALLQDHPPVGYKNYYPTDEAVVTVPTLVGRVGTLESKGYVDYVDWAPSAIAGTGCAQSGLMFSQARVGEAYTVAGNATLSGCLATAQVDTSGILTISVRNPGVIPVTVGVTRWNVYRL